MNTEIYAIRKDYSKYKQLDLGLMDVIRHRPADVKLDDIFDFSLNSTEMSKWWVTPETKFIDYKGEPPGLIPDLGVWIDATLVLSPKAYRILGDLLKPYGEFLPVEVKNETYYIFNCLTVGEVDEEKSIFDYVDDTRVSAKSLNFKNSALDLLIFKTPMENCATIFCTNKLKDIVNEFDIKGVIFDEKLIPAYIYADK